MKNIVITKVSIEDIEELQTIIRSTFYETFAPANTQANMSLYLDEAFSLNRLTIELEDPNAAFYFAKWNNKIVGYLKLNLASQHTEGQNDQTIELERIYVVQPFQGKQVGQKLFEKALQIAAQKKVDYIWLGVWEENPKAIRFYKKNGFLAFGQQVFPLGDDPQTDILMKRQL